MKNLLKFIACLMITFSIFTVVVIASPTKIIVGKEYKVIFGTPVNLKF